MLHEDDESLLTDERFINYCLHRNEQDVLYWEKFIRDNPGELSRIEELRMMVLLTSHNIHEIELKNQIALLNEKIELSEALIEHNKSVPFTKIFSGWRITAAAACLLIIAGLGYYYISVGTTQPSLSAQVYLTKSAEKKSLVLPDGSKVILNAESNIAIPADFGNKDRRVILDGEAFFDVTHDAEKPFIVQTSRMDVKVLGTAFNVKAYHADATYETSLIRGSIQLSLKKEHTTVMLRPNEKYVLREKDENKPVVLPETIAVKNRNYTNEGLLPVKIDKKDTSIVEVSWTDNKLAFADEPFEEVAKKLERWYGVSIKITDPEIAGIPYTASFRNEDIMNVLAALQFSKPFTFKKENNEIIISK